MTVYVAKLFVHVLILIRNKGVCLTFVQKKYLDSEDLNTAMLKRRHSMF